MSSSSNNQAIAQQPQVNVPDKKKSKIKKVKNVRTARAFYTKEYFASTKQELEDESPGTKVPIGDVSRRLKEKWAQATADQKIRFEQMKDDDIVRHRNEMDSLTDEERKANSTRRRTSKKTSPIKKHISAYMFFVKHRREGVSNQVKEELAAANDTETKSFGLIGKRMGELWRTLSEAEKAPYVEMSNQDHIRFQNDKAALEMIEQAQAGENN